ncbi:MAG: hypothetical protein OEZ38_04735 [Gammaproteobacteria bacterium]|nr:hypothetical protein [Gammaproteobacteria bacterium]
MKDNEQLDIEAKKDMSAANIWTAIVLITIAIIVGMMPFFYLKDMVVPG